MLRNDDGTIKIYGHEEQVAYLMSLSPRNIFLWGPMSVGKRTILEKYIEVNHITDVVYVGTLTKDNISQISIESSVTTSSVRAIVFRLSTLTRGALERLLKVVEDAPESVIFLCHCVFEPKITLWSRFTVVKVGHLTDAQVSMILIRLGYSTERAAELADLHTGNVYTSIELGKYSQAKPRALEALDLINKGDCITLDALYASWDDSNTKMLFDMALERITGRYRVSSDEELAQLTKQTALKILNRLDPQDRPRYVVRGALASIARENEK